MPKEARIMEYPEKDHKHFLSAPTSSHSFNTSFLVRTSSHFSAQVIGYCCSLALSPLCDDVIMGERERMNGKSKNVLK
jgi:hypothetical protein